jgi:NADH:ubiquinone oxidoreductase subunit F (NADH-binding)
MRVESAGLRGPGGAAFPTGVKLRSIHDRSAPRYIVANGQEGEPASLEDRWLLRSGLTSF